MDAEREARAIADVTRAELYAMRVRCRVCGGAWIWASSHDDPGRFAREADLHCHRCWRRAGFDVEVAPYIGPPRDVGAPRGPRGARHALARWCYNGEGWSMPTPVSTLVLFAARMVAARAATA